MNNDRISMLSKALDAYPVAFLGNSLNLLFIEEANLIPCPEEYLKDLDGPGLCDEKREFIEEDHKDWPFPKTIIEETPDPWDVTRILFEKYDYAASILVNQKDIIKLIIERAETIEADVIALLIVDGLSYYDVYNDITAIPCMVNGLTTTKYGYRQIIGKPTISQRLFEKKFITQLGLTYFKREQNELAADIFSTFGDSQMYMVNEWEECIRILNKSRVRHGYIQITAPGLDSICHFHRGRPPYRHYLDRIIEDFNSLYKCLKQHANNILICLTADHGILWRSNVERFEIAKDILSEDARHPRYIKGGIKRDYTKIVSCDGNIYSLLKAPYITRKLRRTEWGVHGGISAWESIVPLIMYH